MAASAASAAAPAAETATERPRLTAKASPPPPPAARPPQKNARGWWIVPAVVVAVVLIAWLVLAGLPFGDEDTRRIPTERPSDTIAETRPAQRPGQPVGTIIELPGDAGIATTVTDAPPNLADPTGTLILGQPGVPAPVTVPPPTVPPPAQPPAATTPRPAPARPAPPPEREEPMYSSQREPVPPPKPAPKPAARPAPSMITEGEASTRLFGYARNYYDNVSSNCLEVRSHGFQNDGYTMTVWNVCDSSGGSKMLGRWRVDAKTKEVFRQRDDGRYLAP